jgi:DNA helicase-2/ATP-dependent DNA helicase PcrA
MSVDHTTPAREAAAKAFERIRLAVDSRQSFLVEAGAGAGKTSSLVDTLSYLIAQSAGERWAGHRQVACITYTNVAVDEILRRIDGDPRVRCSTIHGFCWEAIKRFQPALRDALPSVGSWERRCERDGMVIADQPVRYTLGLPKITEDQILLGHTDVLKLMAALMERQRFRGLLADRFPYILVDEYQDTDKSLMQSLVRHFVDAQPPSRPVLGLYGDHWQQIYPGACGRITSQGLVQIDKGANFRSSRAIIAVLNKMRPELPQEPDREDSTAPPLVFHTNDWPVVRQAGGQFDGDLSPKDGRRALRAVQEFDDMPAPDEVKVLMLTHRVLGDQQGYTHLVNAFGSLEGLTTLDDPHLKFFVEVLEPLCKAFNNRRYAEMFRVLDARVPQINGSTDKANWNSAMREIVAARAGTVKDVLEVVRKHGLPPLPERLLNREEGGDVVDPKESASRLFSHLDQLMSVPYEEVKLFAMFLAKDAPFATKHGVKGAEFENVIVVASRGWTQYDFNGMLELRAAKAELSQDEKQRLQRNLNLFYVACSRAKDRLVVLFTQRLSETALCTLVDWFGAENVRSLPSPS